MKELFHLKGGSQALSNALINRFISQGGTVRFNCGVEKILVGNGRISAFVLYIGFDCEPQELGITGSMTFLTGHTDISDKNLLDMQRLDMGDYWRRYPHGRSD